MPTACLWCGARVKGSLCLCATCHDALPWLEQHCQRCALPLPINQDYCGVCLKQWPAFDKTTALFLYHPPIEQFITRLKFGDKIIFAKLMGMLLAKHMATRKELPEYIIPVPLHRSRLKERGFNQALEIARPISNYLKIPLLKSNCQRMIATVAQTSLSAKVRRRNINNDFSLIKPLVANHVAIVDDVVTTGSTVNELAKVLKKNGVQTVEVWCCARAVRR